jgi:exopolysaccharide biosynthesis polyprenyl glycosylphosphotransferase
VDCLVFLALGCAFGLAGIVSFERLPSRLLLVLTALMLVPLATRFALAVSRGEPLPAEVGALVVVAVAVLAGWLMVGLRGGPIGSLGVLLGTFSVSNGVLLGISPSRRARFHVRSVVRRVFFVGSLADREDLAREFGARRDFALVGDAQIGELKLVDAGSVFAAFRAVRPSVLVLSEEALRNEQLVSMASVLNLEGVRVRDLRTFFEQEFKKVAVSNLAVSWFLFDIAEIHRRRVYGSVKRVLETAVAVLLLLMTAPFFPLIMLAIKFQSPGPVFFRQARVGKGGRVFLLTKFRSMHPDAEHEHGEWATAAGSRIFRGGGLLRKFRLDELPQLWNVVRGELSLVGPRPEQPAIVERLENEMQFYAARHCIRPGLTGWAQVNYGYGGSVEAALVKLQYDLYYLKRQSLRLDLRILALTARAILSGSGL